jgi:hypothetical protein
VIPVDFILAEIDEQANGELQEIQMVRRLRSSAQLYKLKDREKKVPELRESIVVLKHPRPQAQTSFQVSVIGRTLKCCPGHPDI